MSKIRILTVAKDVAVRRLLAEILSTDPVLEVIATAPNSRIALAKIATLNPDIVVLGLAEGNKEALEMLNALRQAHPLLPIVQLDNSLRLEQTRLSNDCAFIPGPGVRTSRDEDMRESREQIIQWIKLAYARYPGTEKVLVPAAVAAKGMAQPGPVPAPRGQRIEVVAIGASTGGPKALAALLSSLPLDFPVPLVIVQHMLPSFTSFLATQLASRTTVSIEEGVADGALHPGRAWIAPGDHHMELVRNGGAVRLRLHKGPPEHSCRPSVNVLFRSVARIYGNAALGVMLTGMGQDGMRGCQCIREAGGQVLAQDEASSVVWGMPGAVARAGLADEILPLHNLGAEIHRRVMKGRRQSFHG